MNKLISWVEIPATNFKRAVDFYSQVFNLNLETIESKTEKMACFPGNEGAISLSPGFKPSQDGALISFLAEEGIPITLERAENLGGKTLLGKTKIEAEGKGYFALLLDCEGNKIGLYEN